MKYSLLSVTMTLPSHGFVLAHVYGRGQIARSSDGVTNLLRCLMLHHEQAFVKLMLAGVNFFRGSTAFILTRRLDS